MKKLIVVLVSVFLVSSYVCGQEIIFMPILTVEAKGLVNESKNWQQIQRDLERRFETHLSGSETPARIVIETDTSMLPELVDNIATVGKDVAKLQGFYEIRQDGVVKGLVNFRGGAMYTPKGSRFSYGIKSVKHATGPAASFRW